MQTSAYARAGVDIAKADKFVDAISKMVKTTLHSNVHKSIGGYAALYKLSSDQFIAATTDGVGTKLKLAFESGRHETIGIDLVAMSVNDLVCVGATPLFFLDYFATGKLELKVAKAVMKGIVEGCKQGRVALIGGETAEMPGMYSPGEYDLAGFAVGIVNRTEIIDGSAVKPGDVIVGIESSGPHSNGFSLIRRLLKRERLTKNRLFQDCFVPTRIYVDTVMTLKQTLGFHLKGLAHITGGGFLNIPRINENASYHIALPEKFKTPKVFQHLKKIGGLSWKELYTTFNMGIGLVAVVSQEHSKIAIDTIKKSGLRCYNLGRVTKKTEDRSTVYIQDAQKSYSILLKY